MIRIPDDLQLRIRTRARNLLELHRINRKHSVGIDVVQKMLEIMGEQVTYDIFRAALKKISEKEAGS